MPLVYLASAGKTWQTIGAKYLADIKEKLVLDNTTRTHAALLVKNAKIYEEKISAIVQHVQKDYTYKAIEFGRRASIPNTASLTIDHKYGDCKDHALLLHQLLKAVSIPSKLVLVSTNFTIDPSLPSMDQFNHMIVWLPKQDGKSGRFIDPTGKNIAPSIPIPLGLGGKLAFILEDKTSKFRRILNYSSKKCLVRITRDVTVQDQTNLRVRTQLVLSGYMAPFLRGTLKSIEGVNHHAWMQSLFTVGAVSAGKLLSFRVVNLYDNTKNLILDIEYDVSKAAQMVGDRLIVQLPAIWEYYYTDAPSVKNRTTPYRIVYPIVLESNTTVHTPTGFSSPTAIVLPQTENHQFARWQKKVSQSPTTTKIHLRYQLTCGTYAPNTYAKFAATTRRFLKSAGSKLQFPAATHKK